MPAPPLAIPANDGIEGRPHRGWSTCHWGHKRPPGQDARRVTPSVLVVTRRCSRGARGAPDRGRPAPASASPGQLVGGREATPRRPPRVTSSWAAAASTERIGRRRDHRVEAGRRPRGTGSSPPSRARGCGARPRIRWRPRRRPTSSGRAVSSPSTSSAPGLKRREALAVAEGALPASPPTSRAPARLSEAVRRGSSSATQPTSTSPMPRPEATAIDTHANGSAALGVERAVDRVDDDAHRVRSAAAPPPRRAPPRRRVSGTPSASSSANTASSAARSIT